MEEEEGEGERSGCVAAWSRDAVGIMVDDDGSGSRVPYI
jgi:hypothetical protein